MAARRQKSIRRTTSGKSPNYRKTKSGAGMTAAGVKRYRKANPGSKLKTAVRSRRVVLRQRGVSPIALAVLVS